MSRAPKPSIYQSRSFYRWKVSIQASWASNSAWAARWYAEQATVLARLKGAPIEACYLAREAKEAARHAARDAGIALAEYEKCRGEEKGDYALARERAEIGAHWCAKAEQCLTRITKLVARGANNKRRPTPMKKA